MLEQFEKRKEKAWAHIRDLGSSQAAAHLFYLFRESFKVNASTGKSRAW